MIAIRLAIPCLAVALAAATAIAPSLAQEGQKEATPQVAPPPEAAPRPWREGDPAPSVEGIHLGDSEAQVIAVLGQPAAAPPGLDDADAAQKTLRYRGGALMIALDRTDRVVKIMLRKSEGGSIAGIRVGDRLGRLVHLWGQPTDGAGSTGKWPMGDWTVSVRGDMVSNVVLRILLARTPSAPPPAPPAQ